MCTGGGAAGVVGTGRNCGSTSGGSCSAGNGPGMITGAGLVLGAGGVARGCGARGVAGGCSILGMRIFGSCGGGAGGVARGVEGVEGVAGGVARGMGVRGAGGVARGVGTGIGSSMRGSWIGGMTMRGCGVAAGVRVCARAVAGSAAPMSETRTKRAREVLERMHVERAKRPDDSRELVKSSYISGTW